MAISSLSSACAHDASGASTIDLIGRASVAGDARDKSGLSAKLEDGTPGDTLGGFGSAIAWTGVGDRYVTAVDRGPKDGATSFANRLQWFDVVLDLKAAGGLSVSLVATTMLVDESGRALTARVEAYDEKAQEKGLRFDAEGVRVSPTGTLFVSDEYGPWIVEFSREGRMLRRLPVPEHYRVKQPGPSKEDAIAGNDAGRVTNRGFEGLALSSDGKALFALVQHPLIQDGGRKGRHARLLEVPIDGGPTREYVVTLDDEQLKFNEIVAIGANKFLVIERDDEAGAKAKTKRIVAVDITDASDVSSVESLPKKALPDGLKPAKKQILFDLLDPRFGLAGAGFPEKIEGLCFGPDLPDGRRSLVVTSDNDFELLEPSHVWVFAVPSAALGETESRPSAK